MSGTRKGQDYASERPCSADRVDALPDNWESVEPVDVSAHETVADLTACADMPRRTFLKTSAVLGLACTCCGGLSLAGRANAERISGTDERFVAEAQYYEKLPHRKIKCKLCPRQCVIDDRERGYCGVRENHGGTYYTLVHSRPCTFHTDPIEKKPFFHFLPGTQAFSLATAGCNVNCQFCQNWQISQTRPEQVRSIYMPPEQVVTRAQRDGCASIAYTYSEPIIFYEYMIDTARAGRAKGVKSVVVTGGYIEVEPLRELCGTVDAIKVDLKAFTEKYYEELVHGELRPVLDAMVVMRSLDVWTEIVYLTIPTLNDSDEEFTALCRWIVTELGPDVPLHFTRFHPDYLLKNLPPTPVSTLERAKAIADAEGLHFAYVGNVPGHPAENTYCPGCRRPVIERSGFFVRGVHLEEGNCRHCGQRIPGVWKG